MLSFREWCQKENKPLLESRNCLKCGEKVEDGFVCKSCQKKNSRLSARAQQSGSGSGGRRSPGQSAGMAKIDKED